MSEEEELATEKQVKMYAALLHRLAEKEGVDYKEMREKVKSEFGFTNAAKLGKSEISEIITKLMGRVGAKVIDGDCDKEEEVEEKNGEEGAKVIDGDCDKEEEDLTVVSGEYEDLEGEGLEPEEGEEGEKDLVKQYVQLYADIWEEVLRNKTFAGIEPREQGIAVAGVFREIIKTQRTERIAQLRRLEENDEEGE